MDGVPGVSAANRIGIGSSFGLKDLLKLKASGVIAPARFWPQVRDRRSCQGVIEAILVKLGNGYGVRLFCICEVVDAGRRSPK